MAVGRWLTKGRWLFGRHELVAVGRSLWVSQCGSVAVNRLLWIGCCGSVAVSPLLVVAVSWSFVSVVSCRLLDVGRFMSVIVGWLLLAVEGRSLCWLVTVSLLLL